MKVENDEYSLNNRYVYSWPISLRSVKNFQAYLRDMQAPFQTTAIKQVTQFFCFPSTYKSYVHYTVVY